MDGVSVATNTQVHMCRPIIREIDASCVHPTQSGQFPAMLDRFIKPREGLKRTLMSIGLGVILLIEIVIRVGDKSQPCFTGEFVDVVLCRIGQKELITRRVEQVLGHRVPIPIEVRIDILTHHATSARAEWFEEFAIGVVMDRGGPLAV